MGETQDGCVCFHFPQTVEIQMPLPAHLASCSVSTRSDCKCNIGSKKMALGLGFMHCKM